MKGRASWAGSAACAIRSGPRVSTTRSTTRHAFISMNLVDEYAARGLTLEEAARAARRRLGNLPLARDRSRDVDTLRWLADFVHDVRYASSKRCGAIRASRRRRWSRWRLELARRRLCSRSCTACCCGRCHTLRPNGSSACGKSIQAALARFSDTAGSATGRITRGPTPRDGRSTSSAATTTSTARSVCMTTTCACRARAYRHPPRGSRRDAAARPDSHCGRRRGTRGTGRGRQRVFLASPAFRIRRRGWPARVDRRPASHDRWRHARGVRAPDRRARPWTPYAVPRVSGQSGARRLLWRERGRAAGAWRHGGAGRSRGNGHGAQRARHRGDAIAVRQGRAADRADDRSSPT